jgi:peptidylprolyl isomerase
MPDKFIKWNQMIKALKSLLFISATILLINNCTRTDTQKSVDTYPPPVAIDTVLSNGLIIKDLELGAGIPVDSGYYFFAHYTGYINNNEVFDTSQERNTPINFQLGVGQIIPAWEIGIKGMRAGGKRMLTTPPELAYGETGIPGILPAGVTLHFEIEMIEVIKPPVAWDISSSRMRSTESGIQYVIIENGRGNKPEPNDLVAVNYSGYLEDNTLFDSSLLRSEVFRFRIGTEYVIKGWDEIIQDMRVGEKRVVIIPPELAYGNGGLYGIIPPDAILRFDIELIEIAKAN